MAISAAERARLREELLKTYPLEPQVLDYLLDIYQADPQWLYKRMQDDIRAEKTAAKSKASDDKQGALPAPAQ